MNWWPYPLAALGIVLAALPGHYCTFVASWEFLTGFLGMLLLESHRESAVAVQGLTHLGTKDFLFSEWLSSGFMAETCK